MELFSSTTGSGFLLFYAALLAAASAASWAIPARWRDSGRSGEVPDAESAALLAGGPRRLADAVLADLYVRGRIEAAGGSRLAVGRRSLAASPAGKALLSLEEPLTPQAVQRAIAPHADRLSARLRRAGLLMWPESHLRLRWLSVAPLGALLLFGLYRLRLASTEGEPTRWLVILLVLTSALAVLRFLRSDPLTKAGISALAVLRERRGRGAGGARGEDAAMAVALWGTAVLAGTPFEALHALRQPVDASGSSADGGSSGWGDWGGDASCDAGGGDGGGCGD